jgi:transcriptional regulator with XRE-family HTH domain
LQQQAVPHSSFVSSLTALRARQFTQREIAARAGMSPTTVRLIERGGGDQASLVKLLSVRGERLHLAVDGFGDIDPMAAGRGTAAAAAVAARYAGLIDEVLRNPCLTPEQRTGAIASLRQRQSAEAAAVSKRIMDEAKGAAKARRMMRRKM